MLQTREDYAAIIRVERQRRLVENLIEIFAFAFMMIGVGSALLVAMFFHNPPV